MQLLHFNFYAFRQTDEIVVIVVATNIISYNKDTFSNRKRDSRLTSILITSYVLMPIEHV